MILKTCQIRLLERRVVTIHFWSSVATTFLGDLSIMVEVMMRVSVNVRLYLLQMTHLELVAV
jgi:hypothetical protein